MIIDRHGTPFDPSIHRRHADGSPQLNAEGQCIRRGGWPAGARAQAEAPAPPAAAGDDHLSAALPPPPEGQGSAEAAAEAVAQAEAAEQAQAAPEEQAAPTPTRAGATPPTGASTALADLAVGLIDQLSAGLLGPEMRSTPEEVQQLRELWARYLAQHEITEISPGWALALAYSGQLANRAMAHPTIRERIVGYWKKFVNRK